MTVTDLKIGFLGTGRMATALAAGFVRQLVQSKQISGFDPADSARGQFFDTVGHEATVSGDTAVLADCEVIFLAVKPQMMKVALDGARESISDGSLVVSIAAGIKIATLEDWLAGRRVIRVMPNTPCLIGKGACGISGGSGATAEDLDTVSSLLSSVGIVERVPERLLDAVTGLSGSGPAYVFQMIEALSDGGVKAGLPRDVATRLAAQTLAGSAEMVLQTNEHPGVLKDAVTSPGGTTIAGLHCLEAAGVRAGLISAVQAATERSIELG